MVLCDVILRGTVAHVESFLALKRQLCRVFSFGTDPGTPKAGSLVRRGSLRLLSLQRLLKALTTGRFFEEVKVLFAFSLGSCLSL